MTFYVPVMIIGVTGLLWLFTFRESYPPAILSRRAHRLEKLTGLPYQDEWEGGRDCGGFLYGAGFILYYSYPS
jgi:hypothetical protein